MPTTKWRRDRRIRLSSEYHHNNHEPVGTVKPLGESNQSNNLGDNSMEIPLDMSVGGSKPPPPPYRDPLPGSTFCTMSRPSVITQAPKREVISNQENKQSPKKPIVMCDDAPVTGIKKKTHLLTYLFLVHKYGIKSFFIFFHRVHINGRS